MDPLKFLLISSLKIRAFQEPLPLNSFHAVTLFWRKRVTHRDTGSFEPAGLSKWNHYWVTMLNDSYIWNCSWLILRSCLLGHSCRPFHENGNSFLSWCRNMRCPSVQEWIRLQHVAKQLWSHCLIVLCSVTQYLHRSLLRFMPSALDNLVICPPKFDLFYKHNMVKKVTINFILQIFCCFYCFIVKFLTYYCSPANDLVSLPLYIINWTSENIINQKFFLTSSKEIK